ncbi:hypothetical protein EJ05DRAFT_537254 [Pseudovirgaria hyperparasitica]|uniref:BTB domain-containing protein n=1 Tax=Pseudovirgaria hyperparasitica TaxID=470096 RepID=A0A6A6W9Z7_9PEZI|nr:uncharacterized protein EJ05DRAFT_537254 [Pseudovirgaria hyperparasitica]KAF2758854.1 hypothetical protein EJ05DRAFT_537254 [Pseudovirgaria hyperparasitica]
MQQGSPMDHGFAQISTTFTTGQYSDLTIRCKNKIFNVHKVIVCSQCQDFADLCLANVEYVSDEIDLPNDDPLAIQALLEFFYSMTYTFDMSSPAASFLHISVFAVATKYSIGELCLLATTNFQSLASKIWNSPSFVESVRFVYTSTPAHHRALRDIVLDIVTRNIDTILAKDGQFSQVMRDTGDFDVELVNSLARTNNELRSRLQSKVRCLAAL